jgi:fluoride exporter
MSFTTCLFIVIGGAVGTLGRYLISVAALPFSQTLPWGTIWINIIGSFVIGLFGTLTLAHGRFSVSEDTRLFVMVGLCGDVTTYSAFGLQTLKLMRGGPLLRAAVNVVASVVLCIAAVAARHLIAAYFNGDAPEIVLLDIERDA